MSSARPAPPSFYLTPAQRAALLYPASPTLPSASPSAAAVAGPQLPPSVVGRSPAGHIVPKRLVANPVATRALQQPTASTNSQQRPSQSRPQSQSQSQPQPQPQPQPRPLPQPQPQQPPSNGRLRHNADGSSAARAGPAAQPFKPAAAPGQPAAANQSLAAPAPSAPASVSPSAAATASSVPSAPASPASLSSRPPPHHSSAQLPDPAPSASPRVAAHQADLLDALRELVHAAGVGHWQGLSSQARKDVATQLCRDHLFNPQPGSGRDSRTTVAWQAQASWTDYDVWVKCVRNVSPFYVGDAFVTTYTAHFDQVGRLVEFDEQETRGKKNCVVQ